MCRSVSIACSAVKQLLELAKRFVIYLVYKIDICEGKGHLKGSALGDTSHMIKPSLHLNYKL